MPLKLDFCLVGCANNVPMDLTGDGELDLAAGKLDVRLSWSSPVVTVDPVLLAFGGLDWLLALPRRLSAGEPIPVHSMTQVLDESGRGVGETKMVFELRRERAALVVRGDLARCTVQLEVGERITRIQTTRTTVLRASENQVVTTTVGAFETGRGHGYKVASTAILGLVEPSVQDRAALATSWRATTRTPTSAKLLMVRSRSGR